MWSLLNILLWHHFCFYKHRKCLLIIMICLPLGILASLYPLLNFLVARTIVSQSQACQFIPRPTLATAIHGNFEDFMLPHSCKTPVFANCDVSSMLLPGEVNTLPGGISGNSNETTWNVESILNLNIISYTYHLPFCHRPARMRQSIRFTPESVCKAFTSWGRIDRMTRALGSIVLYYPNTDPLVEVIMSNVRKRLRTLADKAYNTVYDPMADMWSAVASKSSKQHKKTSPGCLLDPNDRVLGFASLNAALDYSRLRFSLKPSQNESRRTQYPNPLRKLWGTVGFTSAKSCKTAQFKFGNDSEFPTDVAYELLYDYRYLTPPPELIDLQVLIDDSIILFDASMGKTDNDENSQGYNKKQTDTAERTPVMTYMQPLPRKCVKRPNADMFGICDFVIPFVLIFCFLFAPMNCATQMLTEKSLKLRDYLEVVGVPSLLLKLSWAVFYMLILTPLSLIAAFLIIFLPGGVFAHSQPLCIFVLVFSFNAAQLCFVFLVSALLSNPDVSSKIIMFLHSISYMLLKALISSPEMLHGVKLVGAVILCMYPVVPMALGFKYILAWETTDIGIQTPLLFSSPFNDDAFGGFGICILFLFGDCLLYILLAWYVDQVAPGQFGIRQKPWFLCSPSYWVRTKPTATSETSTGSEPESSTPDLMLTNLTKIYDNGQVGVSNLSVTFKHSEITAFLGQNGAGKSTTLNSVVGLIHPSSGSIQIGDQSVLKNDRFDRSVVAREVSFVPQHDILYPSLSVAEHMQFYARIKAVYGAAEKSESDYKHIEEVLASMKLDSKFCKGTVATSLSGGQKRKLSILIAYLGRSSVVLLDEPTSGVDPHSRRMIWDLMLSHKHRTATVISTHHMQEADVLSDTIAIISGGTLKAVGSPMQLKREIGKDARLIFDTSAQNASRQPSPVDRGRLNENHGSNLGIANCRQNLVEFFKEYAGNLVDYNGNEDANAVRELYEALVQVQSSSDSVDSLHSKSGDSSVIKFLFPSSAMRLSVFVDLLSKLEQNQREIGFSSLAISESSIEEIFFTVTGADIKQNNRPHQTGPADGNVDVDASANKNLSDLERNAQVNETRLAGDAETRLINESNPYNDLSMANQNNVTWWGRQFQGLLLKRMAYWRRSKASFIYQFFYPLVFIILLILIGEDKKTKSDDGAWLSDEGVGVSSPVVMSDPFLGSNLIFVKGTEDRCNNMSLFRRISASLINKGLGGGCDRNLAESLSRHCNDVPKSEIDQYKQSIDDSPRIENDDIRPCISDCSSIYCFNRDTKATRNVPHLKLSSSEILYNLNKFGSNKSSTADSFSIKSTKSQINIHDWILAANHSNHIVKGGMLVFGSISNTECTNTAVVIYSEKGYEQVMLNALGNALLQSRHQERPNMSCESKFSPNIKVSVRPAKLQENKGNLLRENETILVKLVVAGLLLIMAFHVATFGLATFVINEKSSGLKRLQRISGAHWLTYWLANAIADVVIFSICLALIAIIIAVCPGPLHDSVPEFLVVGISYSFITIPFVYFLTFIFKTKSGLENFITVITVVNLFTGFNLLTFFEIVDEICSLEALFTRSTTQGSCRQYDWVVPVNYVLRMLPPFFLADSIIVLMMTILFKRMGRGQLGEEIIGSIYDMKWLGKRIVEALLVGTIYILIILLLESYEIDLDAVIRRCREKIWKCWKSTPIFNTRPPIDLGEKDVDVAAEEERLLGVSPTSDDSDEVVLVRKLHKLYAGAQVESVQGVTFGVPRGQCFGLLGTNGAGKTSLFKILTGYIRPTSGEALICGQVATRQVQRSGFGGSTGFSYCPQENILFDLLTVREHLLFTALIRGISYNQARNIVIPNLLKQTDLSEHVNKLPTQLSGGNCRKLQLALSLVPPLPPIIFLDEPPTGMDPGARRRCWDTISAVSQESNRCAVILTSHTMEECEALCGRVAFMVSGKFYAIGGIQYLKHKFGDRYIVEIRLNSNAEGIQEVVILAVAGRLPESKLLEKHPMIYKWEVPLGNEPGQCESSLNHSLSRVFRVLVQIQRQFNCISDFSVSQVNFEHVFLYLAQKQEIYQSGIIETQLPVSQQQTQQQPKNVNQQQQQLLEQQDQQSNLADIVVTCNTNSTTPKRVVQGETKL